jgi:hypothetical protein
LKAYTVSTERNKFRQIIFKQDQNIVEYGPLRFLTKKSVQQQAKEQQQQTNVRNNNDNNNNETIIEPSPISTYKDICLLITSMMSLLPSTTTSLDTFIGFKILQYRSGNRFVFDESITWPSSINRETKEEVKQAFMLANDLTRKSKEKITTPMVNTTITIQNNNKTTYIPLYRDNRRYCAVCGVSTSTDSDVTFSTLPVIMQPPGRQSTDNQRRVYYSQLCRRRQYLKRLKIPQEKRNNKYIYICELHELHDELTTYKWKDKNNQQQTYSSFLTLPIVQPSRMMTGFP